jgi:thiosulfate dehydrogenase [quinone] large subunit
MLDNTWYTWFAKLIAIGEFMVGIGLIVGALVGIAAFFGTLMNFSFLMAGTTSSNPVLFGLGVFLVLGWKVAGYIGLDRYLLPMLGTPWGGGHLAGRKDTPSKDLPVGGHSVAD